MLLPPPTSPFHPHFPSYLSYTAKYLPPPLSSIIITIITSTTNTTADQGQGQNPGDVLVEDSTLAFLQAKTTLIVQQESTIARLSSELETTRKQTNDRVQAVYLATLEGMRLAETTAAKLELQVSNPPVRRDNNIYPGVILHKNNGYFKCIN